MKPRLYYRKPRQEMLSGKSYSEISNFMKSRMSIAIVRATHIHASRITQSQERNEATWEDRPHHKKQNLKIELKAS